MNPPALFGQDIGRPGQLGSTAPRNDGYDLAGGGSDIWTQSDQFHFAWIKWAGNFEFSVRLASLESTHLYAKAGLMARVTLAPNSPHVYLLAFHDNQPRNRNNGGIEGHVRPSTAAKTTGIYPPAPLQTPPDFPVAFPAVWLRLRRRDDEFALLHSSDGDTWKAFATVSVTLPRDLHLGLAVTSHDDSKTTHACFRNFSLF